MFDKLNLPVTVPAEKKTIYIVLAVLWGALGVHNFYAGNQEKAKAQLIFGLLSCVTCGITGLLSFISAVKDILSVTK